MRIKDIKLNIIPDSRGEDTLEATLTSGSFEASASVPSGKSIGATEVAVLPPEQTLDKLPWLISQLRNHQFLSLDQFDLELLTLDGTKNKTHLGGNLILALSMAFARLSAKAGDLELFELLAKISGTKDFKMPLCFFNLIEGGIHAENSLPFQEYLLIPQTNSSKESLKTAMEAIKLLREKIKRMYGEVAQGDEGGYSVPSQDAEEGLQILKELIDKDNLKSKIGLDVAASTFFSNGVYNRFAKTPHYQCGDEGEVRLQSSATKKSEADVNLEKKTAAFQAAEVYKVGDRVMNKDHLLSYYQLLTTNYPLLSIEDPFDEEDWQGFSQITTQLGNKVWIIGDDLLTTNVSRIKLAHEKNAANAVLIKPNQIGTITETIQAANLAKSYGWKIIVSHRFGETMDTFIADLAIGLGADGLKSGCPLQKERMVKYKRLVEIEREGWLF